MGETAGIARGLSVRQDLGILSANRYRDESLDARKRAEDQRNAYLFAQDLEIGRANNKWDGPQLKKFVESKLENLGRYAYENPDFNSNPMKAAKMKLMKQELRDNPIIQRSARFDQEVNKYRQWINDPDNNMFLDDEQIHMMRGQIDNYLETGSIDGVTDNGREFRFTPPSEGVDMASAIRDHFTDIQGSGVSSYGHGIDGYRQFVTTSDMRKAAYSFYNQNNIVGRTAQRNWNKMPEEVKGQFNNDPLVWIAQQGVPFKKRDKLVIGKMNLSEGGESAGSSGFSAWREQIETSAIKAIRAGMHNPVIRASPGGFSGMIVTGSNEAELRDAVLVSSSGDRMELPYLGMFSNASETGRARFVTVPGEDGSPRGIERTEMEVSMDISAGQMKDMDNVFGSLFKSKWWHGSPDEINDFEISPEYQTVFQKTTRKSEDGTVTIRMNAWLPAPINSDLLYNNKHQNKIKQGDPGYADGGQIRENMIIELSTGTKAVRTKDGWEVYNDNTKNE